jgi:kynurenine formamidase
VGAAPHAHRLGIENLAMAGVQGRGVLVNLADIYGTECVPVNHAMLAEAMETQKVEVRPGDFLLIYTGLDRVILDKRTPMEMLPATGPSLDGRDPALLDWITQSGVVAICSDNMAVEYVDFDPAKGGNVPLPLHDLCLFKQGIHLGEMWLLEELAFWLRDNQRSAFLLTAPPLRLPGSVGSPMTPIATV